jgi:hypothetical protein
MRWDAECGRCVAEEPKLAYVARAAQLAGCRLGVQDAAVWGRDDL